MSAHPTLNRRALLRAAALPLAGLWAVPGAAAPAPPPPQARPLVLTNAWLHPVSSAPISGGRMRVEGGRIVAIGREAEVPLAPDAQVLDLGGRRVYPGLVAAHTALGLAEVGSVRATIDHAEGGPINANARALVAINADSELLSVARSNGVLTALVAPGSERGGLVNGLSAFVQLDGWHWDDMALVRELALHVTLPTLNLSQAPEHLREELRRHAQAQLRRLDEAFEAAAAYGRARAADPRTPTDLRWEAMQGALQGRQPVLAQAQDLGQIRHALQLAQRHRLRLVIVGGADAWRLAPLLKAQQVPVIIGGVNELPLRRDDDIDARFRLPARLHEAGVSFCIARSGGPRAASNERNLPYEAAAAVAYGLPRDEALKAITLYPAQILGVADRVGSLQPGRLAHFIVTDGDPLEQATQVQRLFVAGREVDAGNRQLELQRRYEQRLQQLGR